MTPVCSVIIAAYNEQRRIGLCLRSLLEQSFSPLEILVVDDGSTDGTVRVAGEFPGVRVMTLTHQGKAAAVNQGAREAGGEILFFLDADMVFDREYIARMADPILSGEAIGTAHAQEWVANHDNVWASCVQLHCGLPPKERLRLTAGDLEAGSTVYRAVRRDLFLQAGGFDDTGYFDDQTLYPKLRRKAAWVREASCSHYNPETLGEVFASGVWAGKSIVLRRGARLIISFFPLLTPLRAVKRALARRSWPLMIFEMAYDWGIFYGGCRFLMHWDRSYGK